MPARLTLACELDPSTLTALFADGSVIGDLQELRARIALMLSNLSDIVLSRRPTLFRPGRDQRSLPPRAPGRM